MQLVSSQFLENWVKGRCGNLISKLGLKNKSPGPSKHFNKRKMKIGLGVVPGWGWGVHRNESVIPWTMCSRSVGRAGGFFAIYLVYLKSRLSTSIKKCAEAKQVKSEILAMCPFPY